eukprot:3996552-Prymnesium_polylepis.1
MWFVSSLDGTANAANNIPVAMEVGGEPIKLGALRAALVTLYQRHASLRTAYVDDEPASPGGEHTAAPARPVVARVLEPAAAKLEVALHGVAGLDAVELARRVAERANAPFDLTRGQLLRADAF